MNTYHHLYKPKSIIILFILLFTSNPFFAQQKQVEDSIFNTVINGKNRKNAIVKAHYHYLNSNVDDGFIVYRRLINALSKEKDYVNASYMCRQTSFLFQAKDNNDSANYYLEIAREYAEKSGNIKQILSVLNTQIALRMKFHITVNVDSLMDVGLVYIAQIDTNETTEISLEKAKLYCNVAKYYDYKNKQEIALLYYELAIEQGEMLDINLKEVKEYKAKLYFGIGNHFYRSSYIGQAKKILLETNRLYKELRYEIKEAQTSTILGAVYKAEQNFDSSLYYFQVSYRLYENLNQISNTAGALENIGIAYKDLGEYDEALKYYNESLEIRKGLNRPFLMIGLYVNMSTTYALQEKYTEAEQILHKAVDIGLVTKGAERAVIVAYQNLAEVNHLQGDYKDAYKYLRKFKNSTDSLNSLKIKKQQAALDKKLELFEKDAEIRLSKLQNENLIHQNKKNLNLLIFSIFGIAILIILVVVIILYNKQKQKNQKLIHEKEKEDQQNEVLKLLNTKEVSSMNAFMNGQEKERSRIASDLHDRLGSLLSTVKLHFSSLQLNLEKEGSKHISNLNHTIDLLDKSVEEVRSVSHNLTKGVITQFGLLAAVENMQQAINETGKLNMIVVDAGFEKRLESETEINLFRVIQEMVTNVIKHAEASELIVQFVQNDDNINIIIEDDGKGFNPNTLNSKGIGLQNMYNRINDIGAEYNLDTKPGYGTTYVIELKF